MNLVGRRYGHIRVERMLGQGGMGDVYEGYDETLARRVALKVLHDPGQRLDQEARTRFAREARTLGRLDHPNICKIYDFIDQDADILVLEHIDGQTLQKAMHESLPLHEKLRIAQAIAEVLVVAHRAGILHRDLKPENVMLTKSGEVKVLDFGLARWVERERRVTSRHMTPVSPAELTAQLSVTDSEVERWYAVDVDTTAVITPPPDHILPDATAAGITVGTPLYMSPEQARGEALTTASDIYAFGLLLQTLFTEKDPYPDGITAREVMLRAARGDSLPVEGHVPRSVASLIRSLKAIAPADRPTAVEALRRIRHIVDTPKRYARRALLALAIVVVVLGTWKYVTDLRRERSAAQHAEAEARRRRAQADSLIGFMLGDLRTKLEPVGRLDILDDAAERSLAYMSSLRPELMTADELVLNGKALDDLVQVRIDQGRLREAADIANRSLSISVAAAGRDANSEAAQFQLALSHFWIGNVCRLSADTPCALSHMRAYRDATEHLALLRPADRRYESERAYGHAAYGAIVEAQGKLNEAAREYETTLAIYRRGLEADPNDSEYQAETARALNKLGVINNKTGDLTHALQKFREESSIYEQLIARDPKQTDWQARLAASYGFTSIILMDMGQIEDASAKTQEEIRIEATLCARDPQNTAWRRNYAISQLRLAQLLRFERRLSDAIPLDEAAGKTLSELVRKDPSRVDWKRDLCASRTEYARALFAAGRRPEASEMIDRAVATIATPQPADAIVLTHAYLVRGNIERASGKEGDALRDRATAASIGQSLGVARDGRSMDGWARILIANGRTEEAKRVIAQLHSMGYHNPDLEQMANP